jgi:hypothetical protein
MAEENDRQYDYGFYTKEQLEEYYDDLIGDFGNTLREKTFTDHEKTNYLDAVKYVANLVWTEYQTKQAHSNPDQGGALVNCDVLDTAVLSLHPAERLEDMELSEYTRKGLAELHQFNNLILLERHTGHDKKGWRGEGHKGHHSDLQKNLKNLPDNYTAQLAIMGWFLTLSSKMTGFRIPGVGLAPGGVIEHDRREVAIYMEDMETMADAMAENKNWSWPQFAILKEMHLDLKKMHYSFRHNRDQATGKFRPMVEVAPKFPAERGSRRDFPGSQEEAEEGDQL